MITFTITFDDGRTKDVTFERRRLKLKTLRKIQEAQASLREGQAFDAFLPFVATILGITEDEAGEIELGDWEAILAAMQERAPLPNESAPPSA